MSTFMKDMDALGAFMKDQQTGFSLPLTPAGNLSRKAIGRCVTLYYGATALIVDVRGKYITFDTRRGKVVGVIGHIISIHGVSK